MINRLIKLTKKKIKEENRVDISVIIPIFNAEKYLEDCLNSIIGQKRVRIEIILVDDGSTDGSLAIAKKYKENNGCIKIYRTNHKGPGGARNLGVRHAKGEYIAFVDADDVLVNGIYRRMLRSARSNNAEVCICNAARFDSRKKWESDLHDKVFKNYKICTHITENSTLIYDTCCWNKLIDRKLYKREKLSFPEGVVYEDIPFNAKLHMKCNKTVMIAETGYLWRRREEQNNQSITQHYYTEKNINDRLSAAKSIADYLLSDKSVENTLKETVKYKLLETDLRIVLDAVDHMSEEQCKKVFFEIREFIENYMNGKIPDNLSVFDYQRYYYVINNDVKGYLKLLEYGKSAYSSAPVEEKGGDLVTILPDDIFCVDKRSVKEEMARENRRTWIDDVRFIDGEIVIDAHIYIQRYNMCSPSDQKVKVLLVNEEDNKVITVETSPKETTFLTNVYGDVIDASTNTVTSYNYDYTGFSFKIGTQLFDEDSSYSRTKYSVLAEYEDRFFKGTEILKWLSPKTMDKAYKIIVEKDEKKEYIMFGEQKELQIIVKREKSTETEMRMEEDS